jgi:hypothetical protein
VNLIGPSAADHVEALLRWYDICFPNQMQFRLGRCSRETYEYSNQGFDRYRNGRPPFNRPTSGRAEHASAFRLVTETQTSSPDLDLGQRGERLPLRMGAAAPRTPFRARFLCRVGESAQYGYVDHHGSPLSLLRFARQWRVDGVFHYLRITPPLNFL